MKSAYYQYLLKNEIKASPDSQTIRSGEVSTDPQTIRSRLNRLYGISSKKPDKCNSICNWTFNEGFAWNNKNPEKDANLPPKLVTSSTRSSRVENEEIPITPRVSAYQVFFPIL